MSDFTINVWIHRKNFQLLVQKEGQPFCNYYTEVIAAANKCDFHKKFWIIVNNCLVMSESSVRLFLKITNKKQDERCLK